MAKRVVIPEKPNLNEVTDSKLMRDSIRTMRTRMGMTTENTVLLCGVSKQSLNDLELGKPDF